MTAELPRPARRFDRVKVRLFIYFGLLSSEEQVRPQRGIQ